MTHDSRLTLKQDTQTRPSSMGVILDFWVRINQNRHVRKVTGSRITAGTVLLLSDSLTITSSPLLPSRLCRPLYWLLCHPSYPPRGILASQSRSRPTGGSYGPDVCRCWGRHTTVLLSRLQRFNIPAVASLPRWHSRGRSWPEL